MSAPGEDPFVFWLRNLGVMLPFLVLAPWLLRRWEALPPTAPVPVPAHDGDRAFWRQALAALLTLFALANVYQFQPHEYDNLKLLFYAYLALALVAGRVLAGWWGRGGVLRPAAVVVLLLGVASGTLAVLRESTLAWPFLEREEVELGMALRRATPADARFLTADRHNHPVPIVAGRPIVLGYRGWLWTHGARTERHLRDVTSIYRADASAPALLRRYGVDYVVVGPHERRAFAVDEEWFSSRFPVLLASPSYRVYRVGGADAGGAATGASAVPAPPAAAPTNRSAPAGTQRPNRAASK
jgi:hypothetical protein